MSDQAMNQEGRSRWIRPVLFWVFVLVVASGVLLVIAVTISGVLGIGGWGRGTYMAVGAFWGALLVGAGVLAGVSEERRRVADRSQVHVLIVSRDHDDPDAGTAVADVVVLGGEHWPVRSIY